MLGGILGLLALVIGFVAGILHGFGLIGFVTHVMLAVPGVLLVMFVQIMVVMYFGGTGMQVKKAVRAGRLDKDVYYRTRGYKKSVSPWAWLSLLLVMSSTILAGGVHTGVLPDIVHWGLALLAVAATAVAVYREILAIDANELVMNEHEKILAQF